MKSSKQNQKHCQTELVTVAKCGFDSLVIYGSYLYEYNNKKEPERWQMLNIFLLL